VDALTHRTKTKREVANYLRLDRMDDVDFVVELAESVLGAPLNAVPPSKQAEALQDALYEFQGMQDGTRLWWQDLTQGLSS